MRNCIYVHEIARIFSLRPFHFAFTRPTLSGLLRNFPGEISESTLSSSIPGHRPNAVGISSIAVKVSSQICGFEGECL